MKSRIKNLIPIIFLTFLAFFLTNIQGSYSVEETQEEDVKIQIKATNKGPRAIIIIKDKNISIEIKNLDLTTDEADRLTKEIERKLNLKKIPKSLSLNMNLDITSKMLRRAGISTDKIEITYNDDEDKASFHIHSRGNKVKIFEDAKVEKDEKFEDVVVISGDLDFAGEADNVVVIFGDVKIHPEAKIHDDIVVLLGSSDISSQTYIGGEQVSIEVGESFRDTLKTLLIPGAILSAIAITPLIIFFKIFTFLIAFGFALLLFHIFPETTKRSKDYLKANIFPSLGYGVLGLLMIIPLFLFLLLSIIGIPLIPVVAVLLAIILFGGYAVIAHYIGSILPVKFIKQSNVWSLLAGILILCLVSFVPIIGHLLKCLAVTTGFGAVCYIIFHMIFKKKQVQSLPPVPPVETGTEQTAGTQP